MAYKHMKRGSTSLAIRKMQIKILGKYHYIPIKMAKMKLVTLPNASKDVESGSLQDHWECKMAQNSEMEFDSFLYNHVTVT